MAKKLTKVQKQQLLDWFEQFVQTIETRINTWLQTVPKQYRKQLDKSPESLLILADYLIATFADSGEYLKIENATTFDAVCTYIGEVHRLHYPAKAIWRPQLLNGPMQGEYFVFKGVVGLELIDNAGKDPSDGVQYVLHNRDRNKLLGYFHGCVTSYQKFIKTKAQEPMPGRGGESYHHYCLMLSEPITFSKLADWFNDYFKSSKLKLSARYYNDKRLLIDAGNNYYFHFSYNQGSSVKAVAADIAQIYKGDIDKSLIKKCQLQLEFWGDQDDDGDYFNEHIHILQQLNTLPEVIVYNVRNNCMWEDF